MVIKNKKKLRKNHFKRKSNDSYENDQLVFSETLFHLNLLIKQNYLFIIIEINRKYSRKNK